MFSRCYFSYGVFYELFFCFVGFVLLQQYLENRLKYLATEKAEGRNPYPHKFAVTMSIDQYIKEYEGLGDGQHLEDVSVSLAGSH